MSYESGNTELGLGESGTVIIPAHNESAVIGRCLETLGGERELSDMRVVVACNGCTDATAAIAAASGIADDVLDLTQPSKTAAINAAEGLGGPLPRIYLDADVELTARAARDLLDALRAGAVAARPPIRFDTEGASAAVRCYFRTRQRTPALLARLWGAGVYGLSSGGRARFDEYPDVTAEDLFVDEHFDADEIVIVPTDPVVVRVPRNSRALLKTLHRNQRGRREHHGASRAHGSAELQTTPGGTMRSIARSALAGPDAAMDAAVYIAISLSVRLWVMVDRRAIRWERDDTTRQPPGPTGSATGGAIS